MKKIVFFFFLTVFLNLLFTSSVYTQWFYFGRNKVQYTNFDWHILQTDHFDIYYYPEMEYLAEHGAHFAEKSYHYLENKFNFTINRRIPLIFYSTHLHFQQTNVTPSFIPEGVGGFFEFLKGKDVDYVKDDFPNAETYYCKNIHNDIPDEWIIEKQEEALKYQTR